VSGIITWGYWRELPKAKAYFLTSMALLTHISIFPLCLNMYICRFIHIYIYIQLCLLHSQPYIKSLRVYGCVYGCVCILPTIICTMCFLLFRIPLLMGGLLLQCMVYGLQFTHIQILVASEVAVHPIHVCVGHV
jgi:hypothetical protein